MFGGAIFRCSSLESLYRKRHECIAVSQEIGVGVAVKQWGVLDGVCDDQLIRKWKNMISSGAATRIGPLSKAPGRNMCLYNSINYLRAPASYDLPTTDGPFNVDHYNCNVGRWIRDNECQSDCEYFVFQEISDFGELLLSRKSRFLLYCQPHASPGSIGHFFAAEISQEGDNVYVMDDAVGDTVLMKRDDFEGVYNACVTFACAPKTFPPPQSGHWSYNAAGGGAKKKVFESPVEICAE